MPAPAPPPVPGPCPPPTTAAATLRRPAMRSGCGASTRGRSSLICWSAGSAVTLTRGAGGTSTAAGAARAGIGKKLMTGRSPPPAPPAPPPPGTAPRRSAARPWTSTPAISAACAKSDARARGQERREWSSSRSTGGAGRGRGVGEGPATLIRTPQAKTGHSMLCPAPPVTICSGLFGRRESDDLHPGAVRDVHRVHHVAVLPVRRRLDEDELRRAVLVQLLQGRPELVLPVRLLVDRIAAVGQELEHDLGARRLFRFLLLLRRHLHVERFARQGLRDHEDDEQHQQHVDERRDVD